MVIDELIKHVTDALNDAEMVTWEKDKVVRAIYQGIVSTTGYRPDACTAIEVVTLDSGVQQSLPDGAQRLLDAYCNVAEDDSDASPPLEIHTKSDKDQLDPTWYGEAASGTIYEVLYDERMPDVFWVSPPALEGTKIKLGVTRVPAPLNPEQSSATEFPLKEKYQPAVIAWALYLLFGGDKPESPNYGRALDHKATFFNLLGVKAQSDSSAAKWAQRAKG